MHTTGDTHIDTAKPQIQPELILNHVSGRLKVAPEHTSDSVLKIMRETVVQTVPPLQGVV